MKQPYYEQCLDFLYSHGEITCYDIQEITRTTCPHQIVRTLVTKGIIDAGEWKEHNGKRFKSHKIIKHQKEFNF